jgi:Zinc-binding dehydrogenase
VQLRRDVAVAPPRGRGSARGATVNTAGVDAVFDASGQGVLPVPIELRGGTDRIITIADPQAAELGVTFSAGGGPFGAGLAEHARLVADGALTVRLAQSFPVDEASKAQKLVAAGKVVLQPSS